jgi:hypothetical protein
MVVPTKPDNRRTPPAPAHDDAMRPLPPLFLSPRYQEIADDAWVSVARRPESMRGGAQVDLLPPRLWERLRLQLQDEYRRATGEAHAVLTIENAP